MPTPVPQQRPGASVEALLGGTLDLAITSAPARSQKLMFKPLFRDEMVIVSPDHPGDDM